MQLPVRITWITKDSFNDLVVYSDSFAFNGVSSNRRPTPSLYANWHSKKNPISSHRHPSLQNILGTQKLCLLVWWRQKHQKINKNNPRTFVNLSTATFHVFTRRKPVFFWVYFCAALQRTHFRTVTTNTSLIEVISAKLGTWLFFRDKESSKPRVFADLIRVTTTKNKLKWV